VSIALDYHARTNHTRESVRRSARALDWANRPHPFKEYVELEPAPPPGAELSRLLRYGAGVMKTRRYPGGIVHHFRAYSSAGALYPVEVYVALRDGLFHFHPLEHAMRRLRDEDVRAALADAESVLVLSGILWRTAWKYGERGYRHLWWDAGTMLANLLALADSPRLFVGFVDAQVNDVLGVDGVHEAALCLLALGEAEPAPPVSFEPIEHAVAPLSAREQAFRLAPELHRASSFDSPQAVERFRRAQPAASPAPPIDGELERVIERRISVRDFSAEPIARETLARILDAAAEPIPADAPAAAETFLIANAVEELERGAYRFSPPDRFELLHAGDFRAHAAHLCLDQPLGGLAAATIFWLADLERAVAELGDRGYRWLQLEGGIRAGRAQLAAYAHDLGAVGSTFYDEEVSRFFETAMSPLLCVAIGRR
jgi:SagB-type dehydrogenase family enzyme